MTEGAVQRRRVAGLPVARILRLTLLAGSLIPNRFLRRLIDFFGRHRTFARNDRLGRRPSRSRRFRSHGLRLPSPMSIFAVSVGWGNSNSSDSTSRDCPAGDVAVALW